MLDVEAVAFRAVMYAELYKLRCGSPTALLDHVEEMNEPRGKLALAFTNNLTSADWLIVNVMDGKERNPLALAAAIALLEILDTGRLEAMLHAISPFPQELWPAGEGTGASELIEERWEQVEEAIDRLAFWQRRVEDLPEPSTQQCEDWGDALAGWPPPGQDPSVSARIFEQALALALRDAAAITAAGPGSLPRRANP